MAKYQPAHKKAQSKLNLAKPAVTMAVTASLALSPVLQTAAFAESGTDANDDVKAEQKQASKEEIAAAKADVEKAQKAYDEARANVEKAEKAYDEAKAAEAEAKAGDQEAKDAFKDAEAAEKEAKNKLDTAKDALADAKKAYKDAQDAADALGVKYNELDNKALNARKDADDAKAAWSKTTGKKAEAEANLKVAQKKDQTVADAQKAYNDAMDKANASGQAYNDALNAADQAAQDAKDARSDWKAAVDKQIEAEKNLAAAHKKDKAVADAEAALKKAADKDNQLGQEFNELDNAAADAEDAADAKKGEWDAKLDEVNNTAEAYKNLEANRAKADKLAQDYHDKINGDVAEDQANKDKTFDDLCAANEALAAAKSELNNQQGVLNSYKKQLTQAQISDNMWEIQRFGQMVDAQEGVVADAQAKVDKAQTDYNNAVDADNKAYSKLQDSTKEAEDLKAQWDAAVALVNLGEQYPQLKADADDLGREYNELDNKALKARDAAKAKDAEWAAARDARDEAQADLDAAKNLPSVEDAETALKDAKKAADDAAAKFNKLDNDALDAEKAAKDAEKQKNEDLKAANDAQVALEDAKNLPSLEEAQAAYNDALKADDAAAAKFNELDNAALRAEQEVADAQAAWDEAHAKANDAKVALDDAMKAEEEAAKALEDARANKGAKSAEAEAAAAKYEKAKSDVLDAYADLELAKKAEVKAQAELDAAKKVLDSLVPYVEPAQPKVTTTTTTTKTKAPAKDEKKADEAALPTTGDSVAAQVTIIAGLGAAAIAAGATRRRFNA